MNARVGVRLVALAVLLAIAPLCAGQAGDQPVPQPVVQSQIERLVATIAGANRGGPSEGIPAMADELQRLMGNDREALLQQILLYLVGARGNEQEMSTALLIAYFEFTTDEKIAAIAPHLETDKGALRDVMWDLLSTIDRPNGGRPDFAPYEAWLVEAEPAPAGLIHYMYAVSPIDALSANARIHGRGDAVERARELEQFQSGRFLNPEQARREVDALSSDTAWWVRLYAAHVIRRHPDLALPEIVDRLRSDKNELVRNTVADLSKP